MWDNKEDSGRGDGVREQQGQSCEWSVVTIDNKEPLSDSGEDSSIGSERGGTKSSTNSFESREDSRHEKNGTVSKKDPTSDKYDK